MIIAAAKATTTLVRHWPMISTHTHTHTYTGRHIIIIKHTQREQIGRRDERRKSSRRIQHCLPNYVCFSLSLTFSLLSWNKSIYNKRTESTLCTAAQLMRPSCCSRVGQKVRERERVDLQTRNKLGRGTLFEEVSEKWEEEGNFKGEENLSLYINTQNKNMRTQMAFILCFNFFLL